MGLTSPLSLPLLLRSMANASVLPGELQRENTEDVLQGERLSDADVCPPLPAPAPPVTGREAWEEGDHHGANQRQPAPIIRKVGGGGGGGRGSHLCPLALA